MKSINVHVKESKLLIFALILLFLNTVLLTIGVNRLGRDGLEAAPEDLDIKKHFAEELVDYNQRLAQKLDVDRRTKVRETLSHFHYEISLASSRDELFKVILASGRNVQETILREYENYQQDLILALISQDPIIQSTGSRKNITFKFDQDQELAVEPEEMLEEKTLQKISEIVFQAEFTPRQDLEIEVEEGQVRPVVPFNPYDHIDSLTRELDSIRTTLYDTRVAAGLAELNGPGVIIRIYDAEEGHTSETIVHDKDIRDIVNELNTIGAKGVAIGNQRITATSSIRCVGPVIRVNDESIPVNPVVIRAVGDPEVLASGLDLFSIILDVYGGLKLEIEKVDDLRLPAYSS